MSALTLQLKSALKALALGNDADNLNSNFAICNLNQKF